MTSVRAGADYRFFGGFRLFLAWCVLTSHANAHLPAWVAHLTLGNVGVFAFFVLSGFVIAEACERFYPGAPLRFLTNRLLRIYPTYWLACALAVGIYAALGHPDLRFDEEAVLGNLSIVLATPGAFTWLSLIWAVGIELRFYFVATLLNAALLAFARHRRLVIAAFAGGALALYLVTVASDYTRLATFRHAPYFVLGMALYGAIILRSRNAALIAAIASPFVVHAYYVYNRSEASPGLTTAAFLAMLLAMGLIARVQVSMRTARIDKALGDLTYPLYLAHWPIVYFVEKTFTSKGIDTYAVILALSLAGAGLVLLAEQPITYLRDRVRRRRLYD